MRLGVALYGVSGEDWLGNADVGGINTDLDLIGVYGSFALVAGLCKYMTAVRNAEQAKPHSLASRCQELRLVLSSRRNGNCSTARKALKTTTTAVFDRGGERRWISQIGAPSMLP